MICVLLFQNLMEFCYESGNLYERHFYRINKNDYNNNNLYTIVNQEE